VCLETEIFFHNKNKYTLTLFAKKTHKNSSEKRRQKSQWENEGIDILERLMESVLSRCSIVLLSRLLLLVFHCVRENDLNETREIERETSNIQNDWIVWWTERGRRPTQEQESPFIGVDHHHIPFILLKQIPRQNNFHSLSPESRNSQRIVAWASHFRTRVTRESSSLEHSCSSHGNLEFPQDHHDRQRRVLTSILHTRGWEKSSKNFATHSCSRQCCFHFDSGCSLLI
jgi:hypothetical protein